jgi:flagellar protein FliL
MAEPAAPADGADAPKKKLSGKKLVIILIPVLLLLAGGGAAYFLGFIGGKEPEHEEAAEQPPPPPPPSMIYPMPDILVNLNTAPTARGAFVKLTSTIDLVEEDVTLFEDALPRVIDTLITYMRELRPEDLRGSAGLVRLREELLARIKVSAAPARVNDVLFREILVQ